VGIVTQPFSWGAATQEVLLVATATPSSIPASEPTEPSTDTPEPTVTSTPIPRAHHEGRIIFTSEDEELGILDIAQAELIGLFSFPGIHRRPSVSPDGSRIAFSSYIHETEAGIYISDFEGKDIEQLIDFGADANAGDSVWLDNENIIFAGTPFDYWDIYWINIYDKELNPFFESTAARTSPSWSSESARLAYKCSPGEGWDICVSNSDGGDVTRLTFDESWHDSPSISPDGTKVAFVAYHEGEGDQIYLIDADGENLKRITYSTGLEIYASPAWSPDGRYFAYVSLPADAAEGSKIYIVNSNGNELYQVPFKHSSVFEYIFWSP
jgi:TolB protein